MLAGKYFYSFTVKQRWWISSSWTSMILAGLSGMFMAWDQEGRGGLSKGKVGPWAHCWGMMKQDCRSQSGCNNPGIQQPVQQCPSSVPGVQWMLSWASFPSICGLLRSCPLPQAVWAVCLGTPRCVLILICSSQSQGGCLQTGRLFCQGLRFDTFYFGGLNRKHSTECGCLVNRCGVTNVGILPSGYLLSHKQCCVFYLEEHGALY